MKTTKYKTKLNSKEIVFDVLYNLKSHTLADDKTRYFTDISEIRYKGVDLFDILDKHILNKEVITKGDNTYDKSYVSMANRAKKKNL